MTDYEEFNSYLDMSKESVKAIDSTKRLSLLNQLADSQVGKVLKKLYHSTQVKKISATYLGYMTNEKIYSNSMYGHILTDDKTFRISTCLDKNSLLIQIPVEESKLWNNHSYIYFTTGDLFLIIKTSSLLNSHVFKSELGNYTYNIPDLFASNKVDKFGLVVGNKLYCNSECFDLTNVSLHPRFFTHRLKGAIKTYAPKYCLIRKEQNVYCELYSTLAGINKQHNTNFSSSTLSFKLQKNDKIFSGEITEDIRNKMTSIDIDGKDYLLVNIEELSDYEVHDRLLICKMFADENARLEQLKRNHRIGMQKAIRHLAGQVKSVEEYNYYRDILINWQKTIGALTINKIDEFKQLNQHKPFVYELNGLYHYYKGQ